MLRKRNNKIASVCIAPPGKTHGQNTSSPLPTCAFLPYFCQTDTAGKERRINTGLGMRKILHVHAVDKRIARTLDLETRRKLCVRHASLCCSRRLGLNTFKGNEYTVTPKRVQLKYIFYPHKLPSLSGCIICTRRSIYIYARSEV